MKITFHGAAAEVTGACFLVKTSEARFLIDCGMFQGGREADRKILAALSFEIGRLDFVLVSHAHIDHGGLLPRLTNFGPHGPIYATKATCDQLPIMFKDNAYSQEKETVRQNRARQRARGRRLQRDIAPLYTVAQAEACMRQVHAISYGKDIQPHPGARARFLDAGHNLGAAIVEVWCGSVSARKRRNWPIPATSASPPAPSQGMRRPWTMRMCSRSNPPTEIACTEIWAPQRTNWWR